jgi:hypothetical protein
MQSILIVLLFFTVSCKTLQHTNLSRIAFKIDDLTNEEIMESFTIGWGTFYGDCLVNFSRQFQTEMSNQLHNKFDLMVGIENYACDNEFQLMVGMTPLKTTFQDGYGFALVEVIDRYSCSKILTIYWKSKDGDNENAINSQGVNAENIDFGWCADFNADYLTIERNKIVAEIQGEVVGFECSANFSLFPDLSFNFIFHSEPTDANLKEITKLMKKNFNDSYISEISGGNTKFNVMIDFQSSEIEKGISEINQFIQEYSSSKLKEITKSISIN